MMSIRYRTKRIRAGIARARYLLRVFAPCLRTGFLPVRTAEMGFDSVESAFSWENGDTGTLHRIGQTLRPSAVQQLLEQYRADATIHVFYPSDAIIRQTYRVYGYTKRSPFRFELLLPGRFAAIHNHRNAEDRARTNQQHVQGPGTSELFANPKKHEE